jgi:hypothetical protein
VFEIDETANMYIVPLPDFTKMTIIERYEFIRDAFSLFGNMEQTINLKWYQTGFFRLVTIMTSIIAAMFSGGSALALLAGSTAMSKIAYGLFGEKGAFAVSIAFILISGGMAIGSGSLSGQKLLLASLDFGSKFMSAYTTLATQQIRADIADIETETEDMEDELHDMQSDALYMPLKQYSMYYDNLYSIPYSIYDDANYDMLGQLNKGVRI